MCCGNVLLVVVVIDVCEEASGVNYYNSICLQRSRHSYVLVIELLLGG